VSDTLFNIPTPAPPTTRFVVEVNEVGIFATRIGTDWWTTFLQRFDGTGRVTWTGLCPQGGIARVACDDHEHASWLRGHMVEHGGLHRNHVKVKKLAVTS
jgi:hypothetical protein